MGWIRFGYVNDKKERFNSKCMSCYGEVHRIRISIENNTRTNEWHHKKRVNGDRREALKLY